ncbi:MAG: hypothetical protein TREMPRED_003748 [Tremellales sp. Tagirdzhanova-0007]|nr:MAG: hypothetical protein TREMPRED_003748 [Tremellales sp. Tagirdzhanova-0007]
MPPPRLMGIYPSDSVSEVAASLPIDLLAPGAADSLASDVEYRLHLILQEAKKFMVHAKRGTLLPEDVEYAMEALNVEPVMVPPRPLPQPPFTAVPFSTSSGAPQQLYHVVDDEIDFATYLKQPLPPGLANSAGVTWKAHWLAVEGVQPAIPENPAPGSRAGPSRTPAPVTGSAALRPSARSTLPQELQLYFSRLTTSLIPSSSAEDLQRHRDAALASLRSDAAVAGILVYLVKWFAESIGTCLIGPTGIIGSLLDGIEAILDNEMIFLEPYLHQLLAPVMSVLLTVPLGPHPPSSSNSGSQQSSYGLRIRASEVLGKIGAVYGPSYPGLLPRLVSTLTRTFQSSPFPSPLGAAHPPAGRYEGAALGLAALGAPAVLSGLWGNGGEQMVRIDDLAGRLYPGEGKRSRTGLMKACINVLVWYDWTVTVIDILEIHDEGRALNLIIRPKPESDPIPTPPSADDIAETFGHHFARALEKRPWLASELMRMAKDGGDGSNCVFDSASMAGVGNGMDIDG